jgi:hypothetical protein
MACRRFGQEQSDVPRSGESLWGRDSSTVHGVGGSRHSGIGAFGGIGREADAPTLRAVSQTSFDQVR